MAYISQEQKAKLAPAIKAVLKKYGLKGSIAIKHYASLVVNIQSGGIDFFEGKDKESEQVNTYHIASHHSGKAKDCLLELVAAMKGSGWYNNSDIMTDYFDVAYYVNINIGQWDKPYVCTAKAGAEVSCA
jgi:hypothetical protein